MFSTHPPFAYEHTEDSILARLRCDMPSSMAYKEQPIHSCGAERTRRLSLPAIHRVAVDPVPGTSKLPFPPPRRSLTAPGETVRGDERIASDWPDSPDAVSDHDDWTIVEPIEALNATDKSANKSGVNRCPRSPGSSSRLFGVRASTPWCLVNVVRRGRGSAAQIVLKEETDLEAM
ncbi:uncharacterized protein RCC_02203 [Ramularia collo-cygni]|uniref:Uncharacterized protein n=1 Tax=Ramularia collo-cygni TaxID=112498 RepID=A0A2D3UU09_9PEZI|nr:uncharacterized protein RCC_02203 [Ramularia collo-cygni]CZT16360.1 uncharacterized protein RCC_02203 [Ramularia collo-cygni]